MTKEMLQIKFTLETDIVSTFKARCAEEGVSMTSEIRRFMKDCRPTRYRTLKILTRPQRKKAVLEIIVLLKNIMALEVDYRDAIPEQFAQRYETADQTCERLVEAISSLEEAF